MSTYFSDTNTSTSTPWLGSKLTIDQSTPPCRRFQVLADGTIQWGPGGTNNTDIQLIRTYNSGINRSELNIYNNYPIFGDLNLRKLMIKSYNAPLVTGLTLTDCAQDEGSILFSDVTSGNWLNLYLLNVGSNPPGNPILACNQGLWVKKDIDASGAFMTNSPTNGTGGGAVLIGQGFYGSNSFPPCIVLTSQDTLHLYTNVNSQTHGNMTLDTLTANLLVAPLTYLDSAKQTYIGSVAQGLLKTNCTFFVTQDIVVGNEVWYNTAFYGGDTKIAFGNRDTTWDTFIRRSAAGEISITNASELSGSGTIQGKYKSSDGTLGVTNSTVAFVDANGNSHTLSFKNGICTSAS
jgi:hypothetical protein